MVDGCMMVRKVDQISKREEQNLLLSLFLNQLDSYQTLSREEAEQLHRKLGRLGYSRNEHYLLAQKLTQRPIKSFTTLTRDEADDLLEVAEQQNSVRQMAEPCFVSDEEALAVLQ